MCVIINLRKDDQLHECAGGPESIGGDAGVDSGVSRVSFADDESLAMHGYSTSASVVVDELVVLLPRDDGTISRIDRTHESHLIAWKRDHLMRITRCYSRRH